ncbi:hypothetical protein [Methylobacterium sp. WL8]|uniref:hypothetical protein n=1 Tax=Methylobacterium sp. WL8 TaxID=2603899 RepID=UPI0011C8DFDA|nr:hypothetical protein [Methylobacterium sp. WL8]TXN78332.1 hypothetical protein FV234_22765 [Methylobacterium sp. WL8]
MKNRSGAGPKLAGAVSLAAFIIAASTAPVGAQPRPSIQTQQQAAPQPAQIDRNGVLILIRSTLLALHEANETGNYTVLRDLSAPGFRDANTAARIGEIFASQRTQKLDLSGVAVLDPQLTLLPQIEANGLLHMAGFFPSVPSQVNFELLYAPVDGRWRLFGISVNVGSSTPTAPSPPQPPPAAQVSQQKQVEPPKGKPAAATRATKPSAGEAAPAGP